MGTLPDGALGSWQVGNFQNSGIQHQSHWGPRESPGVDGEFTRHLSHELILHVDGVPKGKTHVMKQRQSRFPNFKKMFRRACKSRILVSLAGPLIHLVNLGSAV